MPGLDRRELLVAGSLGGALASLAACRSSTVSVTPPREDAVATNSPDPHLEGLATVALDAARAAGASYADVRLADYRDRRIASREARVTSIRDDEHEGFGVRVIVDGTWGFAASSRVDRDELVRVAQRACSIARANARLQLEPVELAPVGAYRGVWNTPVRRDAFEVGLDEMSDLLLTINGSALDVDGVSFCTSSLHFVREHKLFASTEGTVVEQTLHRCNPFFTVVSVDRAKGMESRNSYASPQGMGYEYVEDYPWLDDVRQAGRDVVERHDAPSVTPGVRDLILHPTHLWLTIHESIGHPTEYDRALGFEANYAGTSFLTPDKLGHFQLASPIVNFQAEKTQANALATAGWDDDGVATTSWPLVKDGVFVDYQTTRDQAPMLRGLGREHRTGCSYAQSWSDVPFQRMPNIDLVPPTDGPSLDALIADTEDAILILGRGSYSIDHQRYNFQFGGQTYYEVKGGEVRGQLKDVVYQARTPEFWNACDAICGPDEYWLGGSFYDGKGEPGQSNGVSHGCPAARFRGIDVLDSSQEG